MVFTNCFKKSHVGYIVTFILLLIMSRHSASALEELSESDKAVLKIANECRDAVTAQLETLIRSNRLSIGQMFDTFYIPIPNTSPQKYSTQYDKMTDEVLRLIIDQYLARNKKFVFVIAVDKNGYVPTHNSRYSRPLTGNSDADAANNRTKRMFNDRTGLAAARSTAPYLLQQYSRDTGEKMADLSVPVYIQGKHWGAIRIGYQVN